MYLPPTCDRAHPVQLGQPGFVEVKMWLSYLNNSPGIQEVICPWAGEAYELQGFLFYALLSTVIKTKHN